MRALRRFDPRNLVTRDFSRVFFVKLSTKCSTLPQSSAIHSPKHQTRHHDDQYNTTLSKNTPTRASLSSGACAWSKSASTARNHRRPSLDWPTRRPGRPMAPLQGLLGPQSAHSTGKRARAGLSHSGLGGFCCSSSSRLQRGPAYDTVRAAPTLPTRHKLQRHTNAITVLRLQAKGDTLPTGALGVRGGLTFLLFLSCSGRSSNAKQQRFDLACVAESLGEPPCQLSARAGASCGDALGLTLSLSPV